MQTFVFDQLLKGLDLEETMAKDLFHQAARAALEKDGWTVTHDPYTIKILDTTTNIDLGAERLMAAERGREQIAVEVKSFIGPSLTYDFHLAVGQYMNYRRALRKNDPQRLLFLGVTKDAYRIFFTKADVQEAVEEFDIRLFVFDDELQQVDRWVEPNP